MTFARKPGKGVEVGSLRVAMWGIPQKDQLAISSKPVSLISKIHNIHRLLHWPPD
jgi:hypothetical protein